MKLLFLDVEATGVSDEDRLIQLAYKYDDVTVNELFTPPVAITPESKAIHHITEKHLVNKPAFIASNTWAHLKNLAEQDYVLVAHNAKYDMGMLEKEGIAFSNFICTLKVARYLDEGQYANHQLQYLRYFYDLDIDLKGLSAHDALADIIVLEAVLYALVGVMMQKHSDYTPEMALEKMMEVSKLPTLIKMCSWKKHQGKTWEEVATIDRDYVQWGYSKQMEKPENERDVDLTYTLHYYLTVDRQSSF